MHTNFFRDLHMLETHIHIHMICRPPRFQVMRFTLTQTRKSLDFFASKRLIKTQVNLNLKECLQSFLEKFPKFDIERDKNGIV
jgi:hypothetical protein